MSVFKEICIALRKQGHTLSEIVRMTGRPKTTVYGHIRSIPLSTAKWALIRAAAGKHIRKFALARKGKSVRPFKRFKKWIPEMVSLVAHLLFDGGIYPRNGCAYNNRSSALLQRVEILMQSIYAFEPSRYKNIVTGVDRISYHNVALGDYMKNKADELLTRIQSLPKNCKQEFLQAFFDDEGCIDYRPDEHRRSIRGYQKDVRILTLVHILLDDIGIVSRVVKPNEVVIVGKKNLEKFGKEISFSPGVYINGNRTNSRWKKHLEKREILRMAVESFKS